MPIRRLDVVIEYLQRSQRYSPIISTEHLSGELILWLDRFKHIRYGKVLRHSYQNSLVVYVDTKRLVGRSSMTPTFIPSHEAVHVKRILRVN